MPSRQFFCFLAVCLAFVFAVPLARTQDQSGLRIVVVEGEGVLNNVKLRALKPVVVEIQTDGMPASGAAVTFILPNQGPSGTFLNGTATATVNADAQGRATSSAIRPNGATGAMPIRVSASYLGQTASITVNQTNVDGISSSPTGISHGAKIAVVLAIIGGGAALGAVAASRGGSSSSTPQPPAIIITAGTPTVGGPK
jgi:hypothetical protein